MTESEDSDVICWEGSSPIVGTIDLDELIGLIEEEINLENDTFIYSPPRGASCVNAVYVDGKWQPSCLIGRVLWRSGKIDPNVLVLNEAASALDAAFDGVWADKKTALFARQVQENQDAGLQWGYALLKAKVNHLGGSNDG